jgi:hypothetical protein
VTRNVSQSSSPPGPDLVEQRGGLLPDLRHERGRQLVLRRRGVQHRLVEATTVGAFGPLRDQDAVRLELSERVLLLQRGGG